MKKNFIDIGYYDRNGIFFNLWENIFPDKKYSYCLSAAEEQYILRVNGHEIKISEETADNLLRMARQGAFNEE